MQGVDSQTVLDVGYGNPLTEREVLNVHGV